jgi:hypothetical protein
MLSLVKRVLQTIAVFLIVGIGVLLFVHNTKFLSGVTTGFLLTKTRAMLATNFYLPAFYGHVFTGCLVLIIGIFQFRLHRSKPALHRFLGKIYIVTILLVTAPAGLIMGYYSNGGIIPTISFMMLATLWWASTYVAWRKIRKRDFAGHQVYMYRSYALTLSAVTLRLYTFLAALIFGLRGEDVYIWVSCLSWIPNLLIAEILILRLTRNSVSLPEIRHLV